MVDLLYYSNYCTNSKNLINILSKTSISKDIHFICIDKRTKNPNGTFNVILENGFKLDLPPTITKVPALLLPNHGFQVLFGEQIYQHLQPKETISMMKATNNQGEPDSYSLGGSFNYGIQSDQYSFLDMSPDELLAKGNGGTRQMHNYVNANNDHMNIETPPDDHEPDKVKQEDYDRKMNEYTG